ncbi:MAG TPA: gamma-glutamyl-gamma-aminobutyrate hydrolase family protein [Bryobacteraceae bacterium]
MSGPILVVYREPAEVQPYARALESVGAQTLLAEARPGLRLGTCSGLLLTGGTDVDPARYGQTPAPETQTPDKDRDAEEAALIEEALARDVPVLAICRGMQILNVSLGGTLIQHLSGAFRHVKRPEDRGLPAHGIAIEPGTLLAGIAHSASWQVNSRHHQAVDRPGAGLRICARDTEDGTIEAVELPGRRFVLAVQWHPENQAVTDAGQRGLFQSFAEAVKS